MRQIVRSVEAIPLAVPTAPRRSSLGTFDQLQYGLVRIRTEDGIEGVGEISTLWDGQGPVQCAFAEHHLGPAVIGQDAMAINHCLTRMTVQFGGAQPAIAAVEMALWDIAGQALGVPVSTLLGGPVRESVVLSRSVHMAPPDDMATHARGYVADGFTCVKVKVGRGIEQDEAAVSAVRDAVGPDTLLRVDANMGWMTPKHAIRSIRRLERYDLHSVEQPLPPGNIDGLALVRQSVDTPIMADESVWGADDAWRLLQAGAVDMLNVYVAESGGLSTASLVFRMAELVGVPCVIGAMPELGIGTSAAVHLATAMTNLHDPCDASGAIYQSSPDIINERFSVDAGSIRPLSGNGLGVTVNEEVVDRYRVRM